MLNLQLFHKGAIIHIIHRHDCGREHDHKAVHSSFVSTVTICIFLLSLRVSTSSFVVSVPV